jgi:hypothetical protein
MIVMTASDSGDGRPLQCRPQYQIAETNPKVKSEVRQEIFNSKKTDFLKPVSGE